MLRKVPSAAGAVSQTGEPARTREGAEGIGNVASAMTVEMRTGSVGIVGFHFESRKEKINERQHKET